MVDRKPASDAASILGDVSGEIVPVRNQRAGAGVAVVIGFDKPLERMGGAWKDELLGLVGGHHGCEAADAAR